MSDTKYLLSLAEGDIDEDDGVTAKEIVDQFCNELGLVAVKPKHIESGEALYALYSNRLAVMQNCGVDPWDTMTEEDQAIWEAMSQAICN